MFAHVNGELNECLGVKAINICTIHLLHGVHDAANAFHKVRDHGSCRKEHGACTKQWTPSEQGTLSHLWTRRQLVKGVPDWL